MLQQQLIQKRRHCSSLATSSMVLPTHGRTEGGVENRRISVLFLTYVMYPMSGLILSLAFHAISRHLLNYKRIPGGGHAPGSARSIF